MSIISKIEDLRKAKNVRKQDLCKSANINKNMYANYLKGSKMPFDVVNEMLNYLDCELLIVVKYERV